MKLGLIRYKYDISGGAERSLLLLSRGLLQRGHQVHVICSSWKGDAPQGLSLHVANSGRWPRNTRAVRFAREAAYQMELLKLDNCLSLDKVPGSPLIRAGDGCHISWLVRRSPYETWLKRKTFAVNPLHTNLVALERQTFGNGGLKKVVANSMLVVGDLARYYGLGPDKVELIYNGVDEEALAPFRDPDARSRARRELGLDENPVALFLGSGFQRKGLAFAISAMPRMKEFTLLVAGGDRASRFERMASRLEVNGRVRFLGHRDDAPKLIAAADVLLLPTIYDPCANSCLEALSLGVPVVTTSANGASEMVEDGVTGFVVDHPEDSESLAWSCHRSLSLERGFTSPVPTLNRWLDRVTDLLEATAGGH